MAWQGGGAVQGQGCVYCWIKFQVPGNTVFLRHFVSYWCVCVCAHVCSRAPACMPAWLSVCILVCEHVLAIDITSFHIHRTKSNSPHPHCNHITFLLKTLVALLSESLQKRWYVLFFKSGSQAKQLYLGSVMKEPDLSQVEALGAI